MDIFNVFFPFKAPPTGYVGDNFDWLKSLPKHEVFSGGLGLAPDWPSFCPPFRWQEATMECTAFAGCSIASILNKKETGEDTLFSPLELFTRSNGTVNGNSIQNTVNAMQSGLALEKNCPWIGPITEWSPFILKILGAYTKSISNGCLNDAYAIKNVTSVLPDRQSMRSALVDSPLLAVLNVGRGYFDDVAPPPSSGPLHAVVIVKISDDGKILVFDSLMQKQGFDGFHWLSSDFPILYAFGVLDLPNGWKTKQHNSNSDRYYIVLGKYGLRENIQAEKNAFTLLSEARKKNPTHAAYLNTLWDVYLNAIAYGGYTIQDILNDISNIRRGKGGIFDFNRHK